MAKIAPATRYTRVTQVHIKRGRTLLIAEGSKAGQV